MLARSVRNPLVIGLGTGAVLVLGIAPPVLSAGAATRVDSSVSASPSAPADSPTPTPAPDAKLSLQFEHYPSVMQPGKSYSMDVYVKTSVTKAQRAILTVWSSRATVTCVINEKGVYDMGDVTRTRLVAITVAVPSSVTGGKVVVHAHIDADNADDVDVSKSFTVKKPKVSSSHSSSAGSSGGSSGSSASSGSNSSPTSTANPSSGVNDKAPSVAPENKPVLPGINQPDQTPSTAPLLQPVGNSQSMSGSAESPDELTFDELASTQAAWLAALLVAFSLLLTQVRLGKAHARAGRPARPKGAHRRTRRRRRPGSHAL